ncbi:MAG: hypothetical protein K6U80_13965 [Firmicutes bacterium]|nr:hypothetical protein [Bacillota bacterium]
MKRKVLLLLLLIAILFSVNFVVAAKTYEFEIREGEKLNYQTFSITENEGITEVISIDENQEKQVILFQNKVEIISAKYYRNDKEFLSVIYDYQKKKVFVTGSQKMTINLKDKLFDNNAALFYLFGHIYPQPNKIMSFTMLQSKLGRTVEMNLKALGTEDLIISGRTISAYKYEMSLSSRMASLFWPYKYYYWYSVENRVFLKYEGLNEKKQLQTITLINYDEN